MVLKIFAQRTFMLSVLWPSSFHFFGSRIPRFNSIVQMLHSSNTRNLGPPKTLKGIWQISLEHYLLQKRFLKMSMFHGSCWIKSLTCRRLQFLGLGVLTIPFGDLGSQLSSEIFTYSPFPIMYLDLFFINSWALKMLFHSQDAFAVVLSDKMDWFLRYHPFITLLTSKFGWVMALQICFASRAVLKLLKSQKPSPSTLFISNILLYLTNYILFFSPLPPL